jgi:hypothetical protein
MVSSAVAVLLSEAVSAALSGKAAVDSQIDQQGQGFDPVIHCNSCFSSPPSPKALPTGGGGINVPVEGKGIPSLAK